MVHTATAAYFAATLVRETTSRVGATGAVTGASPTTSEGVRARTAAARIEVRSAGAMRDATTAEPVATHA